MKAASSSSSLVSDIVGDEHRFSLRSQEGDSGLKDVLQRQISKVRTLEEEEADHPAEESLHLTSHDIAVATEVNLEATPNGKRRTVTYVFQRDDDSSVVSNQYEEFPDISLQESAPGNNSDEDDEDEDEDARSDATGELLSAFVPTSFSATHAQIDIGDRSRSSSRSRSRSRSPEIKPLCDVRRSRSSMSVTSLQRMAVDFRSSMPELTKSEDVDVYADMLEAAMNTDTRKYYRIALNGSLLVSTYFIRLILFFQSACYRPTLLLCCTFMLY